MAITKNFFTKSKRITNPVIITPEYVITHSSGVGYKSKDSLYNAHNKAGAKSEHAIVDDTGAYWTLPLNYKGGHAGDLGNSRTIGFEICEPANIVYKDAAHTKIDTSKYDPTDPKVKADFEKRYNNAVEVAAFMLKETGLPVDRLISHAEAYKLKLATNHADVGHWFPLFGKSMDTFRADVKKYMEGGVVTYRVQVGAFKNKLYAAAYLLVVKAAGFSDAYVTDDGTYRRVQVGAFHNKDYATAMYERVKKAGFSVVMKEEKI